VIVFIGSGLAPLVQNTQIAPIDHIYMYSDTFFKKFGPKIEVIFICASSWL
jgi:hypothetical protein